MIKEFVEWFFSKDDPIKDRYKIYCQDETKSNQSLVEVLDKLECRMQILEDKIEPLMDIEERLKHLEQENIGTTNELYRLENIIEMLTLRLEKVENIVLDDQIDDQF